MSFVSCVYMYMFLCCVGYRWMFIGIKLTDQLSVSPGGGLDAGETLSMTSYNAESLDNEQPAC